MPKVERRFFRSEKIGFVYSIRKGADSERSEESIEFIEE